MTRVAPFGKRKADKRARSAQRPAFVHRLAQPERTLVAFSLAVFPGKACLWVSQRTLVSRKTYGE